MTFGGLNIVDVFVIVGIVLFAWSGWRQGFVAALFGFTGFLVGGLLGVLLARLLLVTFNLHGTGGLIGTGAVVLLMAIVGQVSAGILGRRVRARITVDQTKAVDSFAGAVLNVGVLVVIGWLLAATAAALPGSSVASQVRSSALLGALDSIVPTPTGDMISDLRGIVNDYGLPQLFDGFSDIQPAQVDAPSVAVVSNPAVQSALPSVVRVEGQAPACDSGFTGSGFVFASGKILTNAHVVAGVSSPQIHVPGVGTALRGRTVYFDPRLDVAILDVPGLSAKVLKMAGPAQRGDDEVIAGYPGGGAMTATAARVRGTISSSSAKGTDIYGNSGVAREIYSLRGVARPGSSGGPLLTVSGTVAGMVFAQAKDDDQTAYALTSAQLAAAISAGSKKTETVSTGACAS